MSKGISTSYMRELQIFRRILRLLFAIAGCMWIVKYVVHFPDEHSMQTFVIGQYQLYLILLTLWGYDYKRESGRHGVLSLLSNKYSCSTNDVTTEHISTDNKLHLFEVLVKRTKGKGWFAFSFIWVLLILSFVQIVRQIIFLVSHM